MRLDESAGRDDEVVMTRESRENDRVRDERVSSRAGGVRLTSDTREVDLAARFSVNVMVTAAQARDRLAWARTIHERIPGAGPFIAVRPATSEPIPATDVDEWFVRAAGGTLFIEDIARLSQAAQARLLSRLTEQSRRAVADSHANHRVRVISGSRRSLGRDLTVGAFSDTLFYRLNVFHIVQPRDDSRERAERIRRKSRTASVQSG